MPPWGEPDMPKACQPRWLETQLPRAWCSRAPQRNSPGRDWRSVPSKDRQRLRAMISRGVRGCELFLTSCRTRQRQGLCTPWLPRFRAIRVDRAQRRKTVFTKFVCICRSPIFAQNASRYHLTVGSHLDPQAEHPVDLPALLRRESVERLRCHLGVGFEQGVPVPLKLPYDLLAALYGRQLLLRRHAGFL